MSIPQSRYSPFTIKIKLGFTFKADNEYVYSIPIDVQEVFIHSLVEGIFYCKMIINNGVEETEVECGVGDGITLALVYDCPIMIKTDVLDSAGINMNDDGSEIDEIEVDIDEKPKSKSKKRVVSVEDLEIMMHKALENEEYEIAAEIRDRIQELKEEK